MELSLDLSLVYVPKTISEYLGEVSKVKDCRLKLSKLDDYVKKLEDEMRKIDAFKRELPLCMLLLNDAIVRLKEEAMQCKQMESVKGNNCGSDGDDGNLQNDMSDKKNWMSSVQLWNNDTSDKNLDFENQDSKSETKQRSEEDDDRSTCENPIRLCNYKRKAEVLTPLKTTCGFEKKNRTDEKEVVSQVTGLSLMTTVPELGSCNLMSKTTGINQIKVQNKPQYQQQQLNQKKQRRCWSPELHRRFVDALQQLGGSQVATPKQIRDLMQVDGLTNDEVKSHLQKYRLHIRKLPTSASSDAQANALWMAKNGQRNEPSKQRNVQSNSPQGPFHGCESAKGISSTEDDSTELEDDDQSESNSWNQQLHKTGEVDV